MKKKYEIGYTAGMFDILHIGHIETLRRAKSMCNFLIVAVGTDEFLRKRKNREPIISFEERYEIIKSLKFVDMVVPEHNLDKISEYQKYKFDVMFAGEDHENEPVYIEAKKILNSKGVDVIYFKHLHLISSTMIRKRIIALKEEG
ncbi:adenylyltransferase/cytidyltransferase family protein [Phocaeicola coprocola]|uniref:adenylyltransferase/cytidyltransferase family protein n=1 Tax=Phocaeicola coprocola TaxID=310298 RepID=UPI00397DBBAE